MHLDRTTPPKVFSFPKQHRPLPLRTVLDNGIKVVSLNSNDREFTRLTVAVNGGLNDAKTENIAAITPELSREGTASMTGADIAETLDFNGAECHTVARTHHTTTTLFSLTSKIDSILPLLAEIVASPSFPAEAISPIAERIAGKIEMQNKQVAYLAGIELNKSLYGSNHPAARVPNVKSIRATSRDDIFEWHRRSINPDAMTIFVAGRVTDTLLYNLNRHFGSITASGPGIIQDYTPYSPNPCTDIQIVDKPDALQCAIAAGLPSVSRFSKDYIPIRIAIIALGGYFGSRLMLNIRENKGLTYGINAILAGGKEGSALKIATECNYDSVDSVIKEIKIEMERLQDPSTFTSDEIDRLRRYLVSSLASMVDSPFATMDTFENVLYAGTPEDYFECQQDAIFSFTAKSIADSARRYLDPANLRISVAGNASEIRLDRLR